MPFTTATSILHHVGDPHSSPQMCFHPKTVKMLAEIGTSTAKKKPQLTTEACKFNMKNHLYMRASRPGPTPM